jgi:Multiubiquitin
MAEHLNDRGENAGVEEIMDAVVDLEEYAREGKRPPLSRGYRIKINGEPFVVEKPTVTGREILTIAGLLPAENYTLRVKLSGEKPHKVGLDERVDLRHPGIEKFKALPRDQTEGA